MSITSTTWFCFVDSLVLKNLRVTFKTGTKSCFLGIICIIEGYFYNSVVFIKYILTVFNSHTVLKKCNFLSDVYKNTTNIRTIKTNLVSMLSFKSHTKRYCVAFYERKLVTFSAVHTLK